MADSKALEILGEVAETIQGRGTVVRTKVVELLAAAEVEKRVTTLNAALTKRADLEREFRKLNRPDLEVFTDLGSLDTSKCGYSKQRATDLKKLKENVVKLDVGVNAALEGNTAEQWKKLTETLAKINVKTTPDVPAEPEPEA